MSATLEDRVLLLEREIAFLRLRIETLEARNSVLGPRPAPRWPEDDEWTNPYPIISSDAAQVQPPDTSLSPAATR